jgi:hypothetical protein
VAGNTTLAGAITGTYPTLKVVAGISMTSGGNTWPGNLNFTVNGTVTLVDNWTVSGSLSSNTAGGVTLNRTDATHGNISVGNGLVLTQSIGGTAVITMTGGNWSGGQAMSSNLVFAGTVTISSNTTITGGSLTYSSGTVTPSGTLQVQGNFTCTTDGASVSWSSWQFQQGAIVTLGANLLLSGTLGCNGGKNMTFAGAYNIQCATLNIGVSGNTSQTFQAGQTLTVTTNLYLYGVQGTTMTMASSSGSVTTLLNYTGTIANCRVIGWTFTRVDASGSSQGIDNWYGGTLTTTTNITNRTSADIDGGGVAGWFAGE